MFRFPLVLGGPQPVGQGVLVFPLGFAGDGRVGVVLVKQLCLPPVPAGLSLGRLLALALLQGELGRGSGLDVVVLRTREVNDKFHFILP